MESHDELLKELHTIRDYLRWAICQFSRNNLYFGHGTDNAHDEAMQLICHALHLPLDSDPALLDARLTREERRLVIVLLETRIKERIPVPYLTGRAWFAGLAFKVDERVLVPRSPIAELIENGFEPWLGGRALHHVLDLCTGSGCIGIACAHYFEEAEVLLTDVCADALAVAQQNILLHELQDRVQARQSDLFDALGDQRFDLILSNPPYVDADDLAAMPGEYRHEPELGLAAGRDGLDIAHRIVREAAKHLRPEGLLIMEVGNSWHALEAAYPQLPFTWIEFERGGHGVFVLSREQLLATATGG